MFAIMFVSLCMFFIVYDVFLMVESWGLDFDHPLTVASQRAVSFAFLPRKKNRDMGQIYCSLLQSERSGLGNN